MARCIDVARRGEFTARPNPLVGALLVTPDAQVYEGCHVHYGEAHAEVNALQAAGEAAAGATLYVTLEPCCHTGKTGPCTEAIIKAGVTTLVYGMRDPNPAVAGEGLDQLRQAGINVRGPVHEEAVRALNPGFIKRMEQGLPWTRVKLAMSLDGRTAMASGESQWITGAEARQDVQAWRARSDAVISGIGTVLADNPGLNVRLETAGLRQPLRVIVDSQLRTAPDARLFKEPGPVLLVTALGESELAVQRKRFSAADVRLISCPDKQGRVALGTLLQRLVTEHECSTVMVESGSELSGAFLREGLVDELIVYVAAKLLGSDARPLLNLPDMNRMQDQVVLSFIDVAMLGKDCRMRSLVLRS